MLHTHRVYRRVYAASCVGPCRRRPLPSPPLPAVINPTHSHTAVVTQISSPDVCHLWGGRAGGQRKRERERERDRQTDRQRKSESESECVNVCAFVFVYERVCVNFCARRLSSLVLFLASTLIHVYVYACACAFACKRACLRNVCTIASRVCVEGGGWVRVRSCARVCVRVFAVCAQLLAVCVCVCVCVCT